ncbi:MAG: hypothetical protein KDA42_20125, partial [Planctomycetales bacterium]|nr:hypothetical protein [Planctomycetales bacterium]
SGNDILLEGDNVGSAATIAVNVQSGSLNVQGGNGDGTANGQDAAAVINGQAITAAANDFAFSEGPGSYSFTVTNGFTGAIDPISIDSQAGLYDVVGGNGDGTANGADATAEINGQQLVADNNRFSITTAVGAFEIDFVGGFTGVFDAVTVTSTIAAFNIQGADENGLASGVDAVAVINGTQETAVGNQFLVTGEHGL